MKKAHWMAILCSTSMLSLSAFSDAQPASNMSSEAKATATYGNPLVYTDGTILIKRAESEWIDTSGNSGSYDMILPVMYCSTTSEMICVRYGDGEDFAVPRKPLAVGDSWTFNATKFMVLPSSMTMVPGDVRRNAKPEAEISLLGQKLSFYVIARMGQNGSIPVRLYLFSPERGLIGDASPAENGGVRINWLQEAYGPGSSEFDLRIAPSAFISKSEVEKLVKAAVAEQN